MPIYEYIAEVCVQSLYCPKRFAFRQPMGEPAAVVCPSCGTALQRVMSSFSAASDLAAHLALAQDRSARSTAPPATITNVFGAGLSDAGCGHCHRSMRGSRRQAAGTGT